MNIFEQSTLNAELKRAISELGYTTPTPIQEKTIPEILNSDNDLIALAQTGTGKTAGFGLPILNKLDLDSKSVQAIILSPTRELALQITNDLENYSKYMDDVKIVAVYGGASVQTQVSLLRKGAHIVVGTPGRTLDMINRKALKINNIQWLVLDEADEMLNMGFKEELDAILENTPDNKQTLLFSATMPDGVKRITKNYLHNPVEITAGKVNISADNVEHNYYIVKSSDRYLALKRIADINPNIYAIVFCRTREETKDVASKLIEDGYNADALHGDLSQAQRDYVMQRFRSKQLQMLVATDVAARGLDINDLTHVINYNLPDDPEVYIHRSGRTGRAGKVGVSITITHSRETMRLRAIEKLAGKKFEYKAIPKGEEICEKRLFSLMDNIEKIEVNEDQIGPFMEIIRKKLDWLDRDELLKRFVSVEFNRFLDYYKNAPDINVAPEKDRRERKKDGERKERGEKEERRNSEKEFTKMFINIGSKNNVKAANLIGMINEYTRTRDIEIGRIDIQRNFTFFEVEQSAEEVVIDGFDGRNYGSIRLVVEIARPDKKINDNRNDDFNDERKSSDSKKRGPRKSDKDSYRKTDSRGGRRKDDKKDGYKRKDDKRDYSRKKDDKKPTTRRRRD